MQGGAASTSSGVDIAVFGDAGEAAVRTKMEVDIDDGAGFRVFAVQGRNQPRSVRPYHRKHGVPAAIARIERADIRPDIIADNRVQRIARGKAGRVIGQIDRAGRDQTVIVVIGIGLAVMIAGHIAARIVLRHRRLARHRQDAVEPVIGGRLVEIDKIGPSIAGIAVGASAGFGAVLRKLVCVPVFLTASL